MRYFPETILIGCLALIAVFGWRAAHKAAPDGWTVEVAPAQGIIGTCRYQGKYWVAQRDPSGAFHCFLKDAP